MERSGSEGTQAETSGGAQYPRGCDLELAQIPIAGFERSARAGLDAGERLSRLLTTLETNIIPRLARARPPPHTHENGVEHATTIDADEVDRFAKSLIFVQDKMARQTIDTLLHLGLDRETLYIDLLAPAARRLGDMWVEDECTFGDVTVGVGRLQMLMHELAAASRPVTETPMGGKRVLLLASPGEQHTLGLSIVSEFFRASRWDVTCTTDTHAPDPVSTVKSEWFDVIGFSAGTHTRLDWLALAIADVRRVSRNSAIVVLVGGPVFSIHPEYVATVGADASAPDGQQAPVVAGRLLRQRALRA